MSAGLLVVVALIYAVVAIERLVQDDVGLSLFALGCVIANCGLAWSAR